MHQVKYALFYDNHTQWENPDVGKDFDPEYFTDQLKSCGVDYVAFHARCNTGMAYYDTKIGTRHPALKYDLFGRLAECCKKKDIALVAYLNGGISTYETVEHREWATHYLPGTDHFGKITPFAITVCYNSPFRAHIIAMIREIASNYPVAGFFIDCLGNYPCVCPTCVKMMKERGFDYTDEKQVREFARQSVLSYCDDIAAAVREIIPDPMLYFNGQVFGSVRDKDTFFDCECLPTAGWGYEFLPFMSHYMRNIKPGMQLLNMTGRFYDWGDFGGLRTADSLKFDLFYGLAQGMRPNVGGHFHPRGDKDQAVFDRIREVYHELQRYDKWYEKAVNAADIAMVVPFDYRAWHGSPAVRSCVRMLEELKMQFDIVLADSEKPWDQYKLLILPEGIEVTDQLADRVRAHIAAGGAFFACGQTAAEKFGEELGVRCLGDCGLDPVYFRMHGDFEQDLPDMFLSLYAKAVKAETTSAVGSSRLVKPYYNKAWTGTHAIYYTPPQEETAMPFITVNGKCVWCAGDLFTGYAQRGALHLRDIFRNVLAQLLPEPLIRVGKLPACVRLVMTEQPGRIDLHLIAYAPEKRANTTVVEDPAAVINGSFEVLTAGRKIGRAYLAPDETALSVTSDGAYTRIKLPPFEGYALAVLELE
ncbi:MAG: alpha-L-fucosidase [Lentisphaeria bacterium]|nr:alpha-L-fucosidase [Lentisphaeria bacterium]